MKTYTVTISGWSECEFITKITGRTSPRAIMDALWEYEQFLTERGLGDPEDIDIHVEVGE